MTKAQHHKRYRQLLHALKTTRLRLGLSQVPVSRRLGKYGSFLSKVELGERKIDPVELLELCRVYGITFHKLFKIAGLN